MVIACLVFKKLESCFLEWLFVLPQATYEGFSFSTFLPVFDVATVFHFSHSDRCILIAHCSFNHIFLISKLFNIFSCAYFPSNISLGEIFFCVFSPFSNYIVFTWY